MNPVCGILATQGFRKPFSHALLKGLRRRGPDAIGFWSDENVKLAHTRLSIIGLDERGAQPMENATHVISFNGEIYNFDQIRRKLDATGVKTTGASDTEVLLYAWSTWGPAILTELTGIWAFAIYDKRARTLTLVRDQFGIKPLYYYAENGSVAASSLLRTLLDCLDEPPALNLRALSEYVRYQFTFSDHTFLRGVKKVLPGHMVTIDLDSGRAESRCYEDILSHPKETVRLSDDWIDDTRKLLQQCIVDSTISDTSFTTFCSGGIDSSLITKVALPDIAYHCNYSDDDCNETFFAKLVVEGTPTRLFVVNAVEEQNLVERLRDIVQDFDELTIGSVILPLDDLLAQVKRRYKVILTGTGGDELFAGYVRYQLAMGECFQDSYKALFMKMKGVEKVSERFEMTHTKGVPSYYAFYDEHAEAAFYQAFDECTVDGDELQAMLRFDRRYFLAGLLNIDDKMCGRHSLEGRPSMLHQEFVRHVLRLDPRDLFDGAQLKSVLKRIASTILPRSVVYRSDKMGFTTPIGTFVNKNSHLIREQIMDSPFRELYHLKGMHFSADSKFGREVFGLLMLDLWLNAYAKTGTGTPTFVQPKQVASEGI